MICWGEKNSCGVFIDQSAADRCDCLRDYCIRDYDPEQRIMVNPYELDLVIDNLECKTEENIMELDQMIRIRSIPNRLSFEEQNRQIIDRLAQRLNELEFDTEILQVKIKEDESVHFVLFANYFSTPAKNVVLIYGHVGVPPVSETDPWQYPPFMITEENDRMYGRGLTNGKGPLMCWIQAIDSWFTTTGDLPVNIKMIIDSNRNSGTQTLRKIVKTRKNFFRAVDLLIGSTNFWITEKVPMLTTSHSGYVFFELEVKVTQKVTSKTELEPMAELCLLMNTLTDSKGNILIKGIDRHVLPVTQHDWNIFCQAEIGIHEYKERMGAQGLPHEDSHPQFLMHKWCLPHVSFHGVQLNRFVSRRDLRKPSRIVATFSVRLVPDQSVRYVSYVVKDHLDKAYLRLKCNHPTYIKVIDQLSPLNEERFSTFNVAAARAYETVFDVKAAIPGTVNACLPVMNELRRYCSKNVQVVALPFCSIHTTPFQLNESFSREAYQKNLELFATYIFEVALVPPNCKCTAIPDYCYRRGKSTETDFIRMMEPRSYKTHVLYEIDEKEIDRTIPVNDALPTVKQVLLGKEKPRYTL